MKKTTIIFFLLFVISEIVLSQNDQVQNRLNLSLGSVQTKLKDFNFSPLFYEGGGITYFLDYEKIRQEDYIFQIRAEYSLANLKAQNIKYTSIENHDYNLSLGYLFSVSHNNKKLNYYLGGGISADIDYVYFDDFDALTYFNLYSINLLGQIRYRVSKKSILQSSLKLPLSGILVRPKHTGWDHTTNEASVSEILFEGELATIGKFLSVDVEVAYTYQLLDETGAPIGGPITANTSTNPHLIMGLPSGNYSVEIVELETPFCDTTTNVVNIGSPPSELVLDISETSNVTCNNNLGVITAIANGGTNPYEYELTGAATVAYSPNGTFTNLSESKSDKYFS